MSSILMNISCPNDKCSSYGQRYVWAKGDCGHAAYLDTDLDVYCEKKDKWPSNSTYCFIGDLYWKCSDCKTCDKYKLNVIAASLGKVMSGLTKSLISAYSEQTVADIETLSAIIDKCSERMRQ
mmetsp:Transcript_61629/g.55616  ORF Transcript_61629/g.55616 Transcript_61629/m.55616 type:complete len:123 (-) Transcript_61629:80-448(-)